MRIFRIKARNEKRNIVKQRQYLGLDKLRMYGNQVYKRYKDRYETVNLYEYNHHHIEKWHLIIDEEQVRRLMNPYLSDITN